MHPETKMTDDQAREQGYTHYGSYCGVPVYVVAPKSKFDEIRFVPKNWLCDFLIDLVEPFAYALCAMPEVVIYNEIGVATQARKGI